MVLLGLSGCRDGGSSTDAGVVDAPPAGGTISLIWRLTDGTNDLTCADVAGISVTLTATPAAGGFASIDTFNCTTGQATSRAIDPVGYHVEVELSAPEGVLASSGRINGVEVTSGGDVSLGEVVFEVAPQGNLTFAVDTDATGPNCDPVPGGGGLDNVVFALRDSANQCVGTFDIAAGATRPEGSYPSDCVTAYLGGCIENDQTISVTGVRSGAYTLTITGEKDGIPCYARTAQFNVPGNNLTAGLMSQFLVSNPDIFGCSATGTDAGVPDAGVPDAMVNDAMVFDAPP